MKFALHQSVRILLTILALTSLTVGVHAKPKEYPFPGTVLDRANPRPDRPFLFTPYAPTYEERRIQALTFTANRAAGSIEGAEAAAVLGMPIPEISENTIKYIEDRLKEREDCADFTAIRLMTALSINELHPFLPPEQYERLKRAALDFKYWITEPGPDTMISWTENHQMVFHSSEYLAGQLFPNETFTNNGQTGAWHKEHARAMIMKWMERRARWGFSEWDSNVYYEEDLGGVMSLAQFARDDDVAAASAIVADIMLFDIASDLYHGIYGTSHGRTYAQDILTGRDHSLTQIISVVTGLGPFSGASGMSTLPMTAGDRYVPPNVIIRIAQEDPPELLNFERHGIPLDKVEQYGIQFDRLEDLPTLWGMGIYSQAEVVDMFVKAADTYNLWNHPFMDMLGPYKDKLPRDGSLHKLRASMEIESDRTLLGEVNKVTYRTPDYMLSAALDYRPGERGNQHHIWQATLSPDAIVFTTNPGSLEINDSHTPCYWGGQNRLPRAAQHKNLAFILYNIRMTKAIGERNVYEYTHAFFPKWAFDEVVEKQQWIFGRAGNGYVALYSALPYSWKDPDSPGVHDAIANGRKNIWICLTGNTAQYGSFEQFKNSVLAAKLNIDVDKLTVAFDAPGVGDSSFSWKGPFTIDGRDIPLNGFKRVQNPYATVEFDTGLYVIEQGGERLTLDFPSLTRKIEKQ